MGIQYEERKKEVEIKLDQFQMRSPFPDTSTSPELNAKPRRRVRRKEKKMEDTEDVQTKNASIETFLDQADTGAQANAVTDKDDSSLYIDVDLPPSSPPASSRDPKAAQASLLEEPPSSGPGFIRVRSGPPLGRRPASSDPVALHQEYRRHWAKANIPGERRHDQLRWAVRGWMMGEEPL